MTTSIGIDWATKPKGRGAVILRSDDGNIAVTDIRDPLVVTDSEAVRLATEEPAAVVAVDIPFGWPAEFASFVNAWSVVGQDQPVPESLDFRFRATDKAVKDKKRCGKTPMPVSADKFALGARLWAEIAREQGWAGRVDVDGSKAGSDPAPIIEVYPGASLRCFGLKSEGYKGDKDKAKSLRVALVDKLVGMFKVSFVGSFKPASLARTDNELDAFVAALTGLAYLGKLPNWKVEMPSTEGEKSLAPKEGWIFFPVPITQGQ